MQGFSLGFRIQGKGYMRQGFLMGLWQVYVGFLGNVRECIYFVSSMGGRKLGSYHTYQPSSKFLKRAYIGEYHRGY